MRRLLALSVLLASCPSSPDERSLGSQWQEAFTTAGWLLNTWGPSADDLYAVGGTQAKGAIMHFDGKNWSPLAVGLDTPLLNWSFGFGHDDVTVVGSKGTILHFDGVRWSKRDAPTDQDLWGVWGSSPNDVWAVGGDGMKDGQATLLHSDGTT